MQAVRYTGAPLRILLAALALPACTSNDEIATVYDPCSPLAIDVAPDISGDERLGVEGAIAAWSRVLPTRIAIGAADGAASVLPIRFESGDTFYRAIYWDSFGMISISRDRLAPEDYPLAIAHELGHAFGLLHVDKSDRASVMNVSNLEVAPTDDDAAAVRARWATCR